MNLVYRYIMTTTKEPYIKGKKYVLLINRDKYPVYYNHIEIKPGEYFIATEDDTQDALDFIFHDKRVVKVKTINEAA